MSLCRILLLITHLLDIVHCDGQSICDITKRVNISAIYSYWNQSSGEIRICLKCPPGFFRNGQCTSISSLNHCHCCPDESFKYTYDNATSCENCKSHCYDHNEVKTDECTKISDIKCQCQPGYFKHEEYCLWHTPCPAGQEVKKPGTPFRDIKCQHCISGETYSNDTSATGQCLNCTRCRSGETIMHKCSQTSNTVCKNDEIKDYSWIAAPVVVSVIVLAVIGILCYWFRRRRLQKEKRARNPERQNFSLDTVNIAEPPGSTPVPSAYDEHNQLFGKIFRAIAKICDTEWKMFIRNLPGGLVEGDINSVIYANNGNLQEQIHAALLKYRDKNHAVTPEMFCEYLNTQDNRKYYELTLAILQESEQLASNGHPSNSSNLQFLDQTGETSMETV